MSVPPTHKMSYVGYSAFSPIPMSLTTYNQISGHGMTPAEGDLCYEHTWIDTAMVTVEWWPPGVSELIALITCSLCRLPTTSTQTKHTWFILVCAAVAVLAMT